MSIFYTDQDIIKRNTKNIDITGPIDLDTIKAEIDKFGPIFFEGKEHDALVELGVYACCNCGTGCNSVVIEATLHWGEIPATTHIDTEHFLSHQSLVHFCHLFRLRPFSYFDSLAELQKLEAYLANLTGKDPLELYQPDADLEEYHDQILKGLGEDASPQETDVLMEMVELLIARSKFESHLSDALDTANEKGTSLDELRKLLAYAYDLGFYTALMKSNYYAQNILVPVAEKGIAAERHYENLGNTGGPATARKSQKMREDCKELIKVIASKRRWEFIMAKIGQQASELLNYAAEHCPEKFQFQANKMVKKEWFARCLEDLKADGILQGIFDEACAEVPRKA